MKEWVEFSKCVGKTIAGVDDVDNDNIIIAFSDGTWSTISVFEPPYPDSLSGGMVSRRPEVLDVSLQLLRLHIVSSDEVDNLRRESREKYEAANRARERAEYERLHAKFGKGEA